MRRTSSIGCLMALMIAGSLRAQSSAPDNHYIMRVGAKYLTGYPYVPRNGKGEPSVFAERCMPDSTRSTSAFVRNIPMTSPTRW